MIDDNFCEFDEEKKGTLVVKSKFFNKTTSCALIFCGGAPQINPSFDPDKKSSIKTRTR